VIVEFDRLYVLASPRVDDDTGEPEVMLAGAVRMWSQAVRALTIACKFTAGRGEVRSTR
jgi:hypothetical protein